MFGIGTNLVTCQKQPALGMVYKLVDIDNEPKLKLSEDKEKMTLPCRKQVFRIWEKDHPFAIADVISLENQVIKEGEMVKLVDLQNIDNRYQIEIVRVVKLLSTVWENGKLVEPIQDIKVPNLDVLPLAADRACFLALSRRALARLTPALTAMAFAPAPSSLVINLFVLFFPPSKMCTNCRTTTVSKRLLLRSDETVQPASIEERRAEKVQPVRDRSVLQRFLPHAGAHLCLQEQN